MLMHREKCACPSARISRVHVTHGTVTPSGYVRMYVPPARPCVSIGSVAGRNINCDIVGDNCKQNCSSITSDVNHATGVALHALPCRSLEPQGAAASIAPISARCVWVAGWQRCNYIAPARHDAAESFVRSTLFRRNAAHARTSGKYTHYERGCLKAPAISTAARSSAYLCRTWIRIIRRLMSIPNGVWCTVNL